jgi:hypothetical protein
MLNRVANGRIEPYLYQESIRDKVLKLTTSNALLSCTRSTDRR